MKVWVNYEAKLQISHLCDAMIRNINDNFYNVSLSINNSQEIYVQIVLLKRTEIEDEYIDDLVTEFESMQEGNFVKKVVITEDLNCKPFDYIVMSAVV